jgi:hypothetical protein
LFYGYFEAWDSETVEPGVYSTFEDDFGVIPLVDLGICDYEFYCVKNEDEKVVQYLKFNPKGREFNSAQYLATVFLEPPYVVNNNPILLTIYLAESSEQASLEEIIFTATDLEGNVFYPTVEKKQASLEGIWSSKSEV